MNSSPIETPRCSFAYAGTYGHECGAPATIVGVKPSEYTQTGLYFAFRCADCAKAHGQDNRGIQRWETPAAHHVNIFRR